MPRVRFATILPLLTTLAACATVPAETPATPPIIELTAGDFHFLAPDTIPGGLVTIRARNTGVELHHVEVLRLAAGHTFEELATSLTGHAAPSWARQVGGVGATVPGETSEITMVLEPGRYVLLCTIPSLDGTPHFAKGMMRAIEVLPATQPITPPVADLVMVLDDYRYELSGALQAGPQTIEVTNAAVQAHEVVLARLEGEYTPMEFVMWFFEGSQGPVRGQWRGGGVALDQGERNWFTVNLEPGRYVLLCFLQDDADGRMHIEHGMVREFRIEGG